MTAALSLLLMLLLAAPQSAKDAKRTWTDTAGQTTEAEFVRVHEGKVILRRGNKVMLTVPFRNLSAQDQQYVRDELGARGEGHLIPQLDADFAPGMGQPADGAPAGMPADPAVPGPVPAERPMPGMNPAAGGMPPGFVEESFEPSPPRVWSDQTGRQIVARFVGMRGTRVELLRDQRRFSYAFTSLGRVDQQYVREEMNRRGQSHLLPPDAGEPAVPSSMPADPVSPPPENSTATTGGVPFEPQMPRQGYAMESSEPTPSAEAGGEPDAPPAGDADSPSAVPEAAAQKVYLCKNCDGELPADFQIGERCPHCGAKIVYEEDSGGGFPGVSGLATPRWLVFIGGGAGALVILVILLRVIAAASRA